MYKELAEFAEAISSDQAVWKDGELWSAVILGVLTSVWCQCDPTAVSGIRSHFGDILSVTSIIFGFVLTTLFFYIQAADTWADDDRTKSVAERLVTWHVWTVFCLLVLIGYVVLLWAFGGKPFWPAWLVSIAYGVLAFLGAYSGFQIVNHVLTIRWVFRQRHDLRTGRAPRSPKTDDTGASPASQE